MLAEMTSEEFEHWRLLELLEPFGERAAYLRNALLCALTANINRASGADPAKVEDFMPATFSNPDAPASEDSGTSPNVEAVRAIMTALMERQNAWISEQEGGAHA